MPTATETDTVPPVPHLTRGYEQVADHYRQLIRTGQLKPGEKLDGIRVIAAHWSTTPNTVQRSIRLLRDEGWIEVRDRRVPIVVGVPHP